MGKMKEAASAAQSEWQKTQEHVLQPSGSMWPYETINWWSPDFWTTNNISKIIQYSMTCLIPQLYTFPTHPKKATMNWQARVCYHVVLVLGTC